MIRMDTTAASRSFSKKCGAVFGSCGWATNAISDDFIDWRVNKWHLGLLMTCGRSNLLDFVSATKIVDLMEGQVARCRVRKTATTFFVLDFELGGASLVKLAKRGIAAFHTSEIELVTMLSQLENEMPDNLEDRQLLLLKHCPWACLSLAARFQNSGDLSAAFEWAMRSVPEDDRANPRINKVVFDMFFKAQFYEDAEKFALRRLEVNPGEPEMLIALQKLARHRGNLTEVELINVRLSSLPTSALSTSFDTIIERQKRQRLLAGQTSASGRSTDSSGGPGSTKSGHTPPNKIGRILGRVFRK